MTNPTYTALVERARPAMAQELDRDDLPPFERLNNAATAAVNAVLEGLREPGDAWDGLPRDIMMWLDMHPKTPLALFRHLELCGRDIPQWLRDDPEMQALDHTPSKGTRCVLIWQAMLDTLTSSEASDGSG